MDSFEYSCHRFESFDEALKSSGLLFYVHRTPMTVNLRLYKYISSDRFVLFAPLVGGGGDLRNSPYATSSPSSTSTKSFKTNEKKNKKILFKIH